MAMVGCHEEYVERVCEILVCVPGDANPGLYTRLRFGLLASSWLPSPVGIVLWRALHVVMLVVSAFWTLVLVTAFLCLSVFMFSMMAIMLGSISALSVVADLVLFVVRFCVSVVGFLACLDLGTWRGASWCTVCVCECMIFEMPGCDTVLRGVPCLMGSYYEEIEYQKWETWARWWEEVVHPREAIVL